MKKKRNVKGFNLLQIFGMTILTVGGILIFVITLAILTRGW